MIPLPTSVLFLRTDFLPVGGFEKRLYFVLELLIFSRCEQ